MAESCGKVALAPAGSSSPMCGPLLSAGSPHAAGAGLRPQRHPRQGPCDPGAGGEPQRQRKFVTPTYLSPILLRVKLRRMGERYVDVGKVRSRSGAPRGCPGTAPAHGPGARPGPRPRRVRADRLDQQDQPAHKDHRAPGAGGSTQDPRSSCNSCRAPRRAQADRGARWALRTDLGAELNRSRRGSEPISAKGAPSRLAGPQHAVAVADVSHGRSSRGRSSTPGKIPARRAACGRLVA